MLQTFKKITVIKVNVFAERSLRGVSWKQRPLRPHRPLRPPKTPKLENKDPPYFGGLQNYNEPVFNVTESWALATRILRLLLASWTGIRGIGFVLNRKTLCFVSSKKLGTTCLFEAFNFHRKQFWSKLKVWLLSISPKTVIIHATLNWHLVPPCFQRFRLPWAHGRNKCFVFAFCVASRRLRTDGM